MQDQADDTFLRLNYSSSHSWDFVWFCFFTQDLNKIASVERVRCIPHRILVAQKKAWTLFFRFMYSELVSDTVKCLYEQHSHHHKTQWSNRNHSGSRDHGVQKDHKTQKSERATHKLFKKSKIIEIGSRSQKLGGTKRHRAHGGGPYESSDRPLLNKVPASFGDSYITKRPVSYTHLTLPTKRIV